MTSASPAARLHNLSIAVTSIEDDKNLLEKAAKLAEALQLHQISPLDQKNYTLLLVYTEKGLQIQLKEDRKQKRAVTLLVDFLSDALTYRRQHGGGIKQALARAVGIKSGIRPTVIDATAGLGKDSFLLASLGCKVTMIERSPLLAALLNDALERAAISDELDSGLISRLTLLQGDAAEILNRNWEVTKVKPDTVYLDPMYPHNRKSALNRQEMRIIRKLVGDDDDADKLLKAALHHAGKRVVVKRPKGAPLLGDQSPTHVISMKNSRYDVYMI